MAEKLLINVNPLSSNYQVIEVNPHKLTLKNLNSYVNLQKFLQKDVSIYDYYTTKKN